MRTITFTSNPNGVLNREVGTTFNYVVPSFVFTQRRRGEEFQVYYQKGETLILVGIAIVEIFVTQKGIGDILALTSWGYPRQSVLTAFQKMYPGKDLAQMLHIIFRWKEKFVTGIKKIHFKSDFVNAKKIN